MKTPREILFQRHEAAGAKLDAIRQSTVAALNDARVAESPAVLDRRYNWREFLFSFRWHFAAMSAVWLVIAFLGLTAGHSPALASSVSDQKIPSAQIIMAALRENRRQLLELIQPSDSRDAGPQRLLLPEPRSQRRYAILTA